MRLLLVDGASAAFRCLKGVENLSNTEGEPTGLRFGFLRMLASYVKKTSADRVVIVWDAHGKLSETGKTVRKEAVDRGYKGNRDVESERAQAVWRGIPTLKELLQLTKYTQAWEDGYEADDVIGSLAKHFASQDVSVVVASPDHDLWQLVGPNIQCWMPDTYKNGRPGYVTPSEVLQDYGVPSQHLLFWRAVIGDRNDNLEGLSLIDGERAAIKAWLKTLPKPFDHVIEYVQQAHHDITQMGRHLIQELADCQNDRLLSNFSLMELKDPGTAKLIRGEPSNGALLMEFQRLEFRSLVKRVTEFTGIPDVEMV